MSKVQNVGFRMDDGDMMPYKVPQKKDSKSNKTKNTEKKGGTGMKK